MITSTSHPAELASMGPTYDCPNDGVPKPERRKFPRGPTDARVEHLFNGFENAIRNLSEPGREPYWGGCLRAMQGEFAELLRLGVIAGGARKSQDEQSAFDDWMTETRPSGDASSIQYQWAESTERAEWEDANQVDTMLARAVSAAPETALLAPAAPWHGDSVTLTARQVANALELIAPDFATDIDQREAQVSIAWAPAGTCKDDDGTPEPAGYRAWITEYPEEGSIPLVDDYAGPLVPVKSASSTARHVANALVAVIVLATFVMCVFIALDANKHRAAKQPFLDTWDHHAEPATSSQKE